MLLDQYQRVVTYGARFRVLRKHLWKGKGKTVLALAEQLGSKYSATIYNRQTIARPKLRRQLSINPQCSRLQARQTKSALIT